MAPCCVLKSHLAAATHGQLYVRLSGSRSTSSQTLGRPQPAARNHTLKDAQNHPRPALDRKKRRKDFTCKWSIRKRIDEQVARRNQQSHHWVTYQTSSMPRPSAEQSNLVIQPLYGRCRTSPARRNNFHLPIRALSTTPLLDRGRREKATYVSSFQKIAD